MDWYYVENGQQIGPVNDGNLNRLLKDGTVKPETLVWRDGLEKWVPYSRMSIGAEAVAAASATVCSECGRAFPAIELAEVDDKLVCPACKPAFEQKTQEEGELRYAGFWIRAGARLIDVLILFTINMLVGPLIGLLFSIDLRTFAVYQNVSLVLLATSFIVQMAYFTGFVGRFGATPGKMACGLRIVRPDGGPLTYWRAFGRFFGETLSGLFTFFIGYVMAGIDNQKRALHDRICDTRVVKK